MAEKLMKENYKEQIKSFQPKSSHFLNGLKAYVIGGLICLIGQVVQNAYIFFYNVSDLIASNLTLATLIFITALLTGIGIFDKLGQFAGAGTLIPVSGLANSMASAALEHKSEGVVTGIAGNMFKIVGAVLVYGVVAAAIIGFIRYSVKILLT